MPDPRTEDGKVLWRAASPGVVAAADWATYLADDAVRVSLLDAVARYGAGLLRGVPAAEGMVTAVAETFGYVRETNYGRIFDVRVVADPANLAFTSRAIAPHTDNPYRDPVPTLQLLHCLRDAAVGGETIVVDGFAAAAALRDTDPVSFAVLTSTPIPFAYVDKETSLTACQPLIALDPRGRIACVRLNNRSMQPVRLPFDEAEAVYAAYRAWTAIVARPEFALGLRLAPGDCLVFDNTRILHARTAFARLPAQSAGVSVTVLESFRSPAQVRLRLRILRVPLVRPGRRKLRLFWLRANATSRAATPTSTASSPPAPSSSARNRPPPSDNSKKQLARRSPTSWLFRGPRHSPVLSVLTIRNGQSGRRK